MALPCAFVSRMQLNAARAECIKEQELNVLVGGDLQDLNLRSAEFELELITAVGTYEVRIAF